MADLDPVAADPQFDFDKEILSREEISRRECTSPGAVIKRKGRSSEKIKKLFESMPRLREIFTVHGKVGEGTFSSVLVASMKDDPAARRNLFALKHLIPTCHPSRIERELKCMKEFGGQENIVQILFCLRALNTVVFVMPYLPHRSFSEYMGSMDVSEIKLYIYNLLVALRRVHSFGVIHRDVKPSNFLYDRENKKFLLVDFGLAQEAAREPPKNFKRKRIDDNEQEGRTSPKRIALQSNIFNTRPNSLSRPEQKSSINNQMSSGKSSITYIPSLTMKSVAKKLFTDFGKENAKSLNMNSNKPVNAITDVQEKKVLFARQKENVFGTQPKKNVRSKCSCFGKPRICMVCMSKKSLYAPRAGTPGFRPPEVLLKYPQQTTAVDMWAVGVILLSFLSGFYPFFHSPDDVTALAELITLFGSDEIKRVAKSLGRHLITSEKRAPVDLQKLCNELRSKKKCRKCAGAKPCTCTTNDEPFPQSAYDLLKRLLDLDLTTRISAEEALQHTFLINVQPV